MKACQREGCVIPLRDKDDDGTGRHKKCPVTDRDGYLKYKRRRLPGLVALQERLQRGEHPFRPEGEGKTE